MGFVFMTNLNKESKETIITPTTLDSLEQVLQNRGYKVIRTKLQITATHGGTWSTNGHFSTITIIDKNDYRDCIDVETSTGALCNPNSGVLASIVAEAENL